MYASGAGSVPRDARWHKNVDKLFIKKDTVKEKKKISWRKKVAFFILLFKKEDFFLANLSDFFRVYENPACPDWKNSK